MLVVGRCQDIAQNWASDLWGLDIASYCDPQ